MDWDYGEDQDDGYMHPNDTFRKYFTIDLQDDYVTIRFYTHNGGYPFSTRLIETDKICEFMYVTIYEMFSIPMGFDPDEVAYEYFAMKKSEGGVSP